MAGEPSSTSWSSAAGVVGAGTALDAVSRGLSTALVEQRDFASGTAVALLQAGARRPALPGDVRLRRWCARPSRSAACCSPGSRRTWCARCPFLYPLHHTWERPYVGAGLAAVRRAGDGRQATSMGVPRHRHLFRGQLARIAPDLRTDDAHRRDPLLRLPGRRRPAGDEHRAHGRGVRRPRRLAHQGDRRSCARATGSSARASRTSRTTARSRCAPRSSSTPAACGPTRSRRCSAAAARSTSRPARASTSSSRATGSAASAASSPRPRSRCCS